MKAVMPAGGLGTRSLPHTKAQPKELLPIVDKPAIQYVVEEATKSRIEDVLIVAGRTKSAIEDHSDWNLELGQYLRRRGRARELKSLIGIDGFARIIHVRQGGPKGLVDATLTAERYVNDEPFTVLLGDHSFVSKSPCVRELIDAHSEREVAVLAGQPVPRREVSRYGVVWGRTSGTSFILVRGVVEKSRASRTSSYPVRIGRYGFPQAIFDHLRGAKPDRNVEVQLSHAIASLLEDEDAYGLVYAGRQFDIGQRVGWLRANLALASPNLRNEVVGDS